MEMVYFEVVSFRISGGLRVWTWTWSCKGKGKIFWIGKSGTGGIIWVWRGTIHGFNKSASKDKSSWSES